MLDWDLGNLLNVRNTILASLRDIIKKMIQGIKNNLTVTYLLIEVYEL